MSADTIGNFRGHYRFLSNFYLSAVEYEGAIYPSAEHAFQAAKSLDTRTRRMVAKADTPGRAKALGRALKLRPDWESVKESVMTDILRTKFRGGHLAKMLLSTGESKLVEGNTWNDRYWGVVEGRGRNRLGYLLMQVRDELRQKQDKTISE